MRKPNRILQAAVIVSLILISSAIFLSQADRIAGKAQATKITGTMVLIDQTAINIGQILANNDDVKYELYLPGTACTGVANVCTLSIMQRWECHNAPIAHDSGYKYNIDFGTLVYPLIHLSVSYEC